MSTNTQHHLPRRRSGTRGRSVRALLPAAIVAGSFGTAVAPTSHAVALDDARCIAWRSDIESVEYTKDGEIISIITVCTHWETPHEDDDKDHGAGEPGIPGGPGLAAGDEDVDCDALKADITAWQQELDEAIAARPAAEQLADELTFDAANDHAAYTAARDDLAAAEAALEAAAIAYQELNGGGGEREMRNGHTVSVSVAFDPFKPGGSALLDAKAKRDAARTKFDQAWATWAYATDQKARDAQAALDRIDNVIATYPQALERARRAYHEQCK